MDNREGQALLEVEKWAKLCWSKHKFFVGLPESFDDLFKVRKKLKKEFWARSRNWFKMSH